jgi:hypothetical protein
MNFDKLLEKYFTENKALGFSPRDTLQKFVVWLNKQTSEIGEDYCVCEPRVQTSFVTRCIRCGKSKALWQGVYEED